MLRAITDFLVPNCISPSSLQITHQSKAHSRNTRVVIKPKESSANTMKLWPGGTLSFPGYPCGHQQQLIKLLQFSEMPTPAANSKYTQYILHHRPQALIFNRISGFFTKRYQKLTTLCYPSFKHIINHMYSNVQNLHICIV